MDKKNLALEATGGMESNAEVAYNGSNAKIYNDAVDKYAEHLEEYSKELEGMSKKLSKDLNNLEILPMGSYLLIQPFKQNPFQKITMEDGVITDMGGYTPTYKSHETGEIEECQEFIKVGTVIETGYKCEFIKPGDIVFYTVASEVIVPFYKEGFVVVDEHRITAVVNEKLTDRRDKIKNGRG